MSRVRCPHCLSLPELERLEGWTEYGCWAGENNSVVCYFCDKDFNVKAEHAGYQATDDFDIDTFLKVHKIVPPKEIELYWVRCFLRDFSEERMSATKFPTSYETDMKPDQLVACKAAFEFARTTWDEIYKKVQEKEE